MQTSDLKEGKNKTDFVNKTFNVHSYQQTYSHTLTHAHAITWTNIESLLNSTAATKFVFGS